VSPRSPDTGSRTLLGRALFNGGSAALGYAAQLLSLAVLARLLGAEAYGRYALVLTWVTVLTRLGNGGADQTLLRFVAAYRVQGDWARLHGVLRWARRRTGLWALGLSAVAAAGALLLGERLSPATRWTFLAGCLAVILASAGQVTEYTLRALHRVAVGILPLQVLRPVGITLGALGLYLLAVPLDAPLAMALTLAATAASLPLLAWLRRRHLPPDTLAAAPKEEPGEWRATAVPLLLAAAMQLALAHTDMLMLGLLSDNAQTGFYSAASRLAGAMVFGLVTVNTVLAPLFSELFATGDPSQLQRLVSRAAAGTAAALLPVALALGLGGKWLLELFGPAFAAGYLPLLVLSAGQMVNAASGSVGYLLTMAGHPAEVSRAMALAAVLNAAGNALLIPRFGAVGAAASTAGAMILWNLVLVWRVRRLTGIRPTALSWLVHT
jgi:O-antigen/teichoic acid export membrane protein